MQIYKRVKAASKAAGDRPYVRIRIGKKVLYLVGDIEPLDEIELISPPGENSSRVIAGHISFGHLDRLGNGNRAAAASYQPRDDSHAFPFEKRRGMIHKFIDQAHAAIFEGDRQARKSGAEGSN